MPQWVRCLFGFHDTDPRSVIIEMGAVFQADVCDACLRPVIGEFICNAWDEAQTITAVDGSQMLRGVNPILMLGLRSGKYFLLGDEEALHELARLTHEKWEQGEI